VTTTATEVLAVKRKKNFKKDYFAARWYGGTWYRYFKHMYRTHEKRTDEHIKFLPSRRKIIEGSSKNEQQTPRKADL
jgi:hypothetical protein